MFTHVLMPLALIDTDDRPVNALIRLAPPQGTKVTLLHVVEPLRDTPYDQLSDFYREIETACQEKMLITAERLSKKGFLPTREITYGDRATKIIEFVTQASISLIVLGSHQVERSSPKERLGTISQKVALFAPCPVLLVR